MINKRIINHVKDVLNKIEGSLFPTLKDVFTTYSDVIKELNTEEQLYKQSEDSKGVTLTPSYALSTKRYKRRKSPPQVTIRVTLKDTGDFYRSVNVIAEDNKLIIETNIDYAKYLTAKYGKDILGVQNENLKDFYNKYIKEELDNNINDIIENNQL